MGQMRLDRLFLAATLAGCATATVVGEDASPPKTDGSSNPPDGASMVRYDAPPGAIDARPPIDAPPGVPDARPPDAPPAGCTLMLANGNFDSGAGAGWSQLSGTYPIVTNDFSLVGITPQSGAWAVWMGGYNYADDQLVQTVTIPASASSLRLRGYRWIASEETGGAYDFLAIQLRSSGGALLESLTTYSNNDTVGSWTPFDLPAGSAHAGQTIQVYLHGTTDVNLNTNFFIDSLSLTCM